MEWPQKMLRGVLLSESASPYPKNLLRLLFGINLARQKIASNFWKQPREGIFMLVLKGLFGGSLKTSLEVFHQ